MLTARQTEVLDYLRAYIQEHERSPTFGEIRTHFGWKSPNAVTVVLGALERKGAITREASPRSIRLCEPSRLDRAEEALREVMSVGEPTSKAVAERYFGS